MKPLSIIASRAILFAGVIAVCTSSATAQSLRVVTVPWLGDPFQPHQVYDTGELILQGTAIVDPACSIVAATWDPGDGTGPVAIPFANPRALELAHTYTGIPGQPYTATLSVTDTCGNMEQDQLRVIVRARSLEVEVNMAIDHGLWRLHKNMILSTSGGVDIGYWNSNNKPATTATGVLAFEANNHVETGDRFQDPYVDTVARGLASIFTELMEYNISPQAAGNPDSNGNGTALSVSFGFEEVYVNGHLVDAIAATRTPQAIAPTGVVLGRTYSSIVQDIMDGYHSGQTDAGSGRGSWDYNYNNNSGGGGSGDNSAAQWWAIGALGADRVFGALDPGFVETPGWVITENLNNFLQTSQTLTGVDTGRYGYRSISPLGGENNGMNTTPSGMVQLIAGGVPNNDVRFDNAEAFMVTNWSLLISTNRIYGMFATAKAMRLAVPTQVELMNGTFDWYGSDTLAGAPVNGLARHLVSTQHVDDTWAGGRWVTSELATAMAVIILTPTIIDPFPVAVCNVDPDVTGVGVNVTFDGTQSFHLDPARTIIAWDWDFDGDGIYDATGPIVQHAYGATGQFDAVLRVTDDSTPTAKTNTSTCPVSIVPPPIPPDSNPGGPYQFCQGLLATLVLDGSASFDPDGNIVAWEWDLPPLDGMFNDAFGQMVDVTAHFAALAPGLYDVGLRVRDNNTLTNVDFTTVRVYGPGTCPNVAPTFTAASGCGTQLMATAGAAFAHQICATDTDMGDIVTLAVSGLPGGAVMNPPLPAMGNPVCSTIEWTPPISAAGNSYPITFTATDSVGHVTQCTVTLTVAECFLLIGRAPGNDQILLGGHNFVTGLSQIQHIYPVTLQDHPSIPLSMLDADSIAAGLGLTRREHFGAVQVLMYAPTFFPTNPDQWSQVHNVFVTSAGTVVSTVSGTRNGIDVRPQTNRDVAGLIYARMPFAIDGM